MAPKLLLWKSDKRDFVVFLAKSMVELLVPSTKSDQRDRSPVTIQLTVATASDQSRELEALWNGCVDEKGANSNSNEKSEETENRDAGYGSALSREGSPGGSGSGSPVVAIVNEVDSRPCKGDKGLLQRMQRRGVRPN